MSPEKKLRILAASDIHGDTRLTKSLANKASREKVDLVVLCGDILGLEPSKNLIKPFRDKKQPILMLPGNWDSFATIDFLANFYGVKNIHGYSAVYNNIGFFGAGGASAPGPGDITEKELIKTLEKAHTDLKGIEKKILVTHQHPANSKSEFSGVPGSRSLEKAIKKFKPEILLHGHIHEAQGSEEILHGTRVINVGREGKILEI
jgi:putative phosphoesterase